MNYREFNDYELIYLVEEENEDAFQIIFDKYQPFIKKIVGRFYQSLKKYGVEYDDLYQEAYLAVVKAVRLFNNHENTVFYTFLSMSVRSKLLNYRKIVLTKKSVFNANMLSLNAKVFDDDNTLEDYIEDKSQISPLEFLEYNDFNSQLKQFCLELPCDQGQIFELLCNGFGNHEIADLLDLSPKVVSNILYKIRKKLKLYLAS